MNLRDLLAPERIVIPLPAKTLHDAAEQLIASFVETGMASEGSKLVARVSETPADEALAVGEDAFILHVRSSSMDSVSAALGVTAEPVSLVQESEKSACIVVVVAGPPKDTATFLQAVTGFAQALAMEGVPSAILAASSAEAVADISALMDVELSDVILVGDVMQRRVRSVTPDTTLAEAARMMTRYHLGSIPVLTEDGEVLGMVNGRDLLALALPRYLKETRTGVGRGSGGTAVEEVDGAGAGAGAGADPENLPVREVMDRSVLCLSEDQSLADVAGLMVAKDTDRFPVVREGIMVGMLTRGGVVRLLFGT
ncbi:MAG: CBS domain-containing protein [Gemmatimonadetes bacterium]|nr:CBS domain-containing protein [Gemmatimonadota bacterium]MCH8935438.1 CBS domain-containing protein [Gemmatimonadota bacterium]